MLRRRRLLVSLGALASCLLVARGARAVEIATPCAAEPLACAEAPAFFTKQVALPVQGGFDTGWVPQNSPLQVHLFAQLYASTQIDLAGRLVTSWPEPLTLETPGDPGGGALWMHYGFEVGAEAKLQITVLGQNFSWTGPIPYLPQFDFQVEASDTFDPWAFDGVSVDGSTMEATLIQVSATDFIGVNIPGLDGGFELNVKADLTGTYQTEQVRVTEDGVVVASIDGNTSAPVVPFGGGASVDYQVQPIGVVVYDGVLHLIPAFYIDTIGPSFSIPIVDIPIPFSFLQKDWTFDPVDIHVRLPDVTRPGDPAGDAPSTEEPVIDLGDVAVGASAEQTIDVTNLGEAALAGTMTPSSSALQLPGTLYLGAGVTGTFHVTLTPTAPGPVEETITLTSNDPDEPERTIRVRANALGVDDGDDDDGDDLMGAGPAGGGCDCSFAERGPSGSGPSGPIGAVGLAMVGLALASRTLRRRRSSRPAR
jgi:hypothetical protein